ncbi:MAG: hypothetical protein Q8R11_01870 [bacterium]|nr:hypothetical protein [bacterium]
MTFTSYQTIIRNVLKGPSLYLLLLSLKGTQALFHPGFFTSHDGYHQIVRLLHFHQGILDGQFPVRWAGQALYGFGYPLFYFTYQLPFFLGELFLRFGFSLADSIKILFILAYPISGLIMYGFVKDLWGKWAGFFAAVLYLWAPYRFSTIFVRGSLGEHFTWIFLPLVLWGCFSLSRQYYRRGVLFLGLGLAGLILSHVIITQLAILPILLFWITLSVFSKTKMKLLLTSILGVFLGLGLASFYLLPSLDMKQYIGGFPPSHIFDHFVTFKQLFYSPWGFGFSFPGTKYDAMSFQLGIPQWIVVGLSVFLILFLLWRRRLRSLDAIAILFLLVFAGSLIMMTEYSKPIWLAIKQYVTVDFPWRFLLITTTCSALLGGYITSRIRPKFLTVVLSVGLIFLTFYANRNHIRVNLYESNPMQYVYPTQTSSSYEEYTPVGANLKLAEDPVDRTVNVLDGEIEIGHVIKTSNLIAFDADAKTNSRLSINQFYFPTWNLFFDGVQQPTQVDSYGIWDFTVPEGQHRITIELRDPSLHQLANITSVLSIGITILLIKNSSMNSRGQRSHMQGYR